MSYGQSWPGAEAVIALPVRQVRSWTEDGVLHLATPVVAGTYVVGGVVFLGLLVYLTLALLKPELFQ